MMAQTPPHENTAVLTVGNSAKLYCLNWIEHQVTQTGGEVTILDLGCGSAGGFVQLLRQYPQVRYVGIEPSPAACQQAQHNLRGLNAAVINGYGYSVYGRLVQEKFDVIVSFSVMEHVYRRQKYLTAARECLKENGAFLVNYDAGHFVAPANLRERAKNLVGPVLARLGIERYYQSFVREAEFRAMAAAAGLKVVEAKSFNTRLKSVYKAVPAARQADYMRRWLAFELWLNELGIEYTDSQAALWFTRNFILCHRDYP